MLPTFTYGTKSWGGDLKNSHWKVFEKGMKMNMMSHIKVHSLRQPIKHCWPNLEDFPKNYMLSSSLQTFNNCSLTYPSLWESPKQPHLPGPWPNMNLTLGTNRQPCGRYDGVYLIGKPMTTQSHLNQHMLISRRFFLRKSGTLSTSHERN